MAKLPVNRTIHVYMDSPVPAFQVQKLSGCQVVARSWEQDAPDYWSIYLGSCHNRLDSVEDCWRKWWPLKSPNPLRGFFPQPGRWSTGDSKYWKFHDFKSQ